MKYIILLLLNSIFLISQEIPEDSVSSHVLGEITISSEKIQEKINQSKVVAIPYRIMQSTDINSLSNMQFVIPSGVIRTNSRGESNLFLRGAAERHLGIFFDGMPLNIAWDNRADLSFIPTDIIGRININANGSSMLYGPNILGGVAEISTLERLSAGSGFTLRTQIQDNLSTFNSLLYENKTNDLTFLLNLSFLSNNDFNNPKSDKIDFQTDSDNSRINTDQQRINAFGRLEYDFFENSKISYSINFTNNSKGVQPTENDERFWIYPEQSRLMNIINFQSKWDKFNLKTTLWYDYYTQTIDQYTAVNFDTLDSKQIDIDNTLGFRAISSYLFNSDNEINFSLNYSNNTHSEELDTTLNFAQNLLSLGAEYKLILGDFSANLGAGYDYFNTPKTGLFTELEGNSLGNYSAFLNLNYQFNNNFKTFASAVRRTRFQSMREALSGALNRFKPNPDLSPELGNLFELGAEFKNDNLSLRLASFYNLYEDLIVQIRLSANEDPERRRQRVNIGKVDIYGLESVLDYKFSDFYLRANLTLLDYNGEENGIEQDTLDNKPKIFGGLLFRYDLNNNISGQFEAQYSGNQYQLNENYITIEPALSLNLRVNYKFMLSNKYFMEIFGRINNLTDSYNEIQLGIIEPGRTLTFGAIFRF